MGKFFQFINFLLLLAALGASGFLFMQMQPLMDKSQSLTTEMAQLKADTDAKLKELSGRVDGLKTAAAPGSPAAPASAPDAMSTPVTPPIVVAPAPTAPPAAPAPAAR